MAPSRPRSKSSPSASTLKSATLPGSKTRTLPDDAKRLLKDWYYVHASNPYPTSDEKELLIRETNLTLVQLNDWFINARRRIPAKMGSPRLTAKQRPPPTSDSVKPKPAPLDLNLCEKIPQFPAPALEGLDSSISNLKVEDASVAVAIVPEPETLEDDNLERLLLLTEKTPSPPLSSSSFSEDILTSASSNFSQQLPPYLITPESSGLQVSRAIPPGSARSWSGSGVDYCLGTSVDDGNRNQGLSMVDLENVLSAPTLATFAAIATSLPNFPPSLATNTGGGESSWPTIQERPHSFAPLYPTLASFQNHLPSFPTLPQVLEPTPALSTSLPPPYSFLQSQPSYEPPQHHSAMIQQHQLFQQQLSSFQPSPFASFRQFSTPQY
ncbi:hypothetical protein T439DRAFT_354879 [Meredithblackwellia eburnea MCA 4105]